MTNDASTLKRLLYAAGVALFLAAPMSLAQFSLTWDFTDGTGTAITGGGVGAYVDNTVVDPLSASVPYLITPAAAGNISWNGLPAGTIAPPAGLSTTSPGPYTSPGYPAATDAWVFAGTTGGFPNHGWLQANGGTGTPLIGGTVTNPTWGDGTLASASYLVIDLPDFTAYSGDPLVLQSVTIEAGSHGQNATAGPEVYGIYELGGGLLGSVHNEWGSDPIPPAQAGGLANDPWLWDSDSPTVVEIDTNDTAVAQSASFDLLFFAGFDVLPPNGSGPFVLDNMTLTFGLASSPGNGGGYGAPNGASGTPEPAGALLGLLSLGMVSFRRKRRN